ncbi:MAG: hypothetical protein FOGNACKC_00727 [Anaerolineae bacterium]|nr:hypothetical protein [Anaerolineae bacterium]
MVISTDPQLFSVGNFVDVHGVFAEDGVTVPPFYTQAVAYETSVRVYGWKNHVMWVRGEKGETVHRDVIGSVNLKKDGSVGQRSKGEVPDYVFSRKWAAGDIVVDGC